MKNQNTGRLGFTLIELLVVVLIIGILASVALPQYQKAVEKSRLAEAKTTINGISKAIEVYKLENGGAFPTSFSDLDLEFTDENGAKVTTESHFYTKNFYYYFSTWGYCFGKQQEEIAAMFRKIPDTHVTLCGDVLICYSYDDDICKGLGFSKPSGECTSGYICYTE